MSQDIDRRRAKASLDSLDVMLEQATRDIDRLAKAGDYLALGVGLERLRGLKRALSDLERHAEDAAAETMPRKIVEGDGLYMERRTSKVRRNWQSEAMLDELFNQSHVDESGVEVGAGEALAIFRQAVRECVPLTGSLQWRVNALRDYGIDSDEWCEESDGRTTVRVEQAKGDGDG